MTANSMTGGIDFEEHPTALASRIASKFDLAAPMEAYDFPEKGNINQHTYLVVGGVGGRSGEFLLQQINQQVFQQPRSVMRSMIACIEAQRRALQSMNPAKAGGWETIELIPTRDGDPYLVFENLRGVSFWRLMRKIPNCRTYKSLGEIRRREEQLWVSREAGRGLALYADLTSGMDVTSLDNPLPGYRDTRLYYNQLESVLRGSRTLDDCGDLLPEDPVVRQSTHLHFTIHLPGAEYERRVNLPDVRRAADLALGHREYAMTLLNGMRTGRIRTVAIHGDTKLDNFLFCSETGRAKALVDLDTIMPHTWLADWGDMVRSLANVAGEKERDRDRIQVDREIFAAIADGFLSTSVTIEESEVELMADAVRIIALELGIRFLTDYIRGDSYFKLSQTDPPDLNRVRGLGQLALFERLAEAEEDLRSCIARRRSGSGAMGREGD